MKIKRSQLKQIIKEEIRNVLLEITPPERYRDYHISADERGNIREVDPELNDNLQLWWDQVEQAEDRGEGGIDTIPNPVQDPEGWEEYESNFWARRGLDPEGPVHRPWGGASLGCEAGQSPEDCVADRLVGSEGQSYRVNLPNPDRPVEGGAQ